MSQAQPEVSPQAERAALAGYLRCVQCGLTFPPGRADKRFCTDRCRAAANREARAAKVRRMEGLIAELSRLTGSSDSA